MSTFSYSQNGYLIQHQTISLKNYNQHNGSFKNDIFGAAGIAIGQEHFAAVKGSIIKPINFGYRPRYYPKYGFYKHGAYASLEGSMFGMFAIWAGLGVNIGYNLGPLTLDNSVTAWGIAGENASFGIVTYNPKVGIRVGPVWLKSGPSFLLAGEEFIDNYLKIGRYNMNFELLYIIPN